MLVATLPGAHITCCIETADSSERCLGGFLKVALSAALVERVQ